jgi:putative ABC transport system permease protein
MCAAAIVFAIFDATMLRPLPFPEDDRLVVPYTLPPGMDPRFRNPLHSIDLVRLQQGGHSFNAVAGIVVREHSLTIHREPEVRRVGHVSAGFHRLLGLQIVRGREFSRAEDRDQANVAIATHAFASGLVGDDDVGLCLGRKVAVDGVPFDIIGVTDRSVRVPFAEVELWVPLGVTESNLPQPAATYIQTVGRLAEGVSVAAADREVRQVIGELGREFPTTHQAWTGGAVALREWQFGDNRQAVSMLATAALFVLFVAWSNVLNLVTAETLRRRAEFDVALALGASPADIVATQLTSVGVLISLGAGVGLLAAAWLLPLIQSSAGASLPNVGSLHIDARVEIIAGLLTVLAAVLAASVPLRVRQNDTLTHSSRTIGSRGDRLVRITLIGVETTLVIALTATAFIFARTLYQQYTAPVGFNAENVLAVQLRMPAQLYASVSARSQALDAMLAKIRDLPGVRAASSVTNPLTPGGGIATLLHVEDRVTLDGKPTPVQVRMISRDYFRTMEIPVLSGRAIDGGDIEGAVPVAVVSKGLAEKFWPGQTPLGRRLRRHLLDTRWMTVVGVVDDVADIRVGQAAEPIVYTAYAQFNVEVTPVALILRTAQDPSAAGPSVRRVIVAQNPLQPVFRIQPLRQFVSDSLAPQRFRTSALAVMTALGLGLAAVGIHGVMARAVAERFAEIGIRKALGASGWQACAVSVRDVALAVAIAIGASCPTAAGLSYLVNLALPMAARLDVPTYLAAVAITLCVTAVAMMGPVTRALKIEPLRALRTL